MNVSSGFLEQFPNSFKCLVGIKVEKLFKISTSNPKEKKKKKDKLMQRIALN